jgi:hypothetical protein
MKHFHFNRLERLADFLYEIPRQKWDFSTVMELGEKPPLEALAAGKHKCGTMGCAVGWAPALFRRDLKWTNVGSGSYQMLIALRNPTPEQRENIRRADAGPFWATVCEYFGLTHPEALFLFNPEGYIDPNEFNPDRKKYVNNLDGNATAKQVAKHIHRFIKAKRKEMEMVSA